MVGKYTGLSDSYLSVIKALLHASVALDRKLVVDWIPSCDLEDSTGEETSDAAYEKAWESLKMVPGGFGDRCKICARIPYLAICLGMQIAVIEFARSIVKLHGANSTELSLYSEVRK